MAYTAGSFVADEQPTTSKWNLLWANDASFNDGTGIGAGAIVAAALATGSVTATKIGTDSSFAWTPWTPTVTAGSGSFTSASGAGRYFQLGKFVFYAVNCTITTVGTGSGCVFTLPVTAAASSGYVLGATREDATSGNAGVVKLASATTASVSRYDNGNILSGGSGSVIRSFGFYEAA